MKVTKLSSEALLLTFTAVSTIHSSIKNFDLSIFLNFSYGGEILNATKLANTQSGKFDYNVLNVCNSESRWTYINKQTGELITDPDQLAAINAGRNVAGVWDMESGDKYVHSWAVENASYIRLKTITLGYNIPRQTIQKTLLTKITHTISLQLILKYGLLIANRIPKRPLQVKELTHGVNYSSIIQSNQT
jgi:hypothetical protein